MAGWRSYAARRNITGIIMEIMATVFIAATIGAIVMWYIDQWFDY
jgi:hypothetical protein